tara:strand:- start:209 stop:415 length:207 start_codon:yes stop_codon:yes gene_type:complete
MKNASDIFKDLPDGSEFVPSPTAREKTLVASLAETLAEMEALMRTKPAYQGGLNIAERAKHALSLYNV